MINTHMCVYVYTVYVCNYKHTVRKILSARAHVDTLICKIVKRTVSDSKGESKNCINVHVFPRGSVIKYLLNHHYGICIKASGGASITGKPGGLFPALA
jgi:hypothetical protein